MCLKVRGRAIRPARVCLGMVVRGIDRGDSRAIRQLAPLYTAVYTKTIVII